MIVNRPSLKHLIYVVELETFIMVIFINMDLKLNLSFIILILKLDIKISNGDWEIISFDNKI